MRSPSTRPIQLTRGYTTALASSIILATTSILIRHLTRSYNMPALVLATWRDALVTVSLLIGLRLIRPGLLAVHPRHLGYLVVFGLVLAIFNALWTLSVAFNGAAASTVMAYCSAGFTALLGWWLLKERLDWSKLLVVCLSLGGCLLVSGALDPAAWRLNLLGIIVGISSGLWYAIYTLMGRSASLRGLNPWTALLYTFGIASIILLGVNLLSRGQLPGTTGHLVDFLWLGRSWSGWGVLVLLAAGPTLAGFGLYNVSLTMLPSSVVNLILTTEPVVTAVTAYALLGERLSWVQIAGGLLILAGVVFLRVYEGRLAARPVDVSEQPPNESLRRDP